MLLGTLLVHPGRHILCSGQLGEPTCMLMKWQALQPKTSQSFKRKVVWEGESCPALMISAYFDARFSCKTKPTSYKTHSIRGNYVERAEKKQDTLQLCTNPVRTKNI